MEMQGIIDAFTLPLFVAFSRKNKDMLQIMNGILGSLKPVLYTVFIFLIVTAMFAVIGKFLSAPHLVPRAVAFPLPVPAYLPQDL